MYHEFDSLKFPQKGSEIKDNARKKLADNTEKRQAKRDAIQKLCEEFKIDAVKIFSNMDSLSNSAEMPSAEMTKLKELARGATALGKENEKLGLIIRNLPEDREFDLTFDELEFFEF